MKAFGLVFAAVLACAGLMPGAQAVGVAHGQVVGQPLDVLHWWTSASERRAADQLGTLLVPVGVHWSDFAVAGGGGMAAVKVLKSRVLMGDPPDVAQLIGSTLTDWADSGLVLPLNGVAARHKWAQSLFPTVLNLVSYKGQVIAAPLGIHRINTLLYNRRVFARFNLKPPTSWEEYEVVSRKLGAAGIKPLAWSDEPWQIATVFESLLLGEVGPGPYQAMVGARKRAGWLDPPVARALQRLRWLRSTSGSAAVERAWTHSARELMGETSAMMIMGDWASGELKAWGASPAADYGCVAVPGTAKMHLFSVDTLAMLLNARQREGAQEKMAETVVSTPAQLAYNRIKGSVPVRRDLAGSALQGLDDCARGSWETFAAPNLARVPSLAHRMAADEATKDAIAQTLSRYLSDPHMEESEAQRRLATIMGASCNTAPCPTLAPY